MRRCRRSLISRWIVSRALLAAALLGVASGCLFQPRESEGQPDPSDQVQWIPPGTLGNALGNMERALESEAQDLTNYGRSFDDEQFELILDPADEAELGLNEFEDWSAQQEESRMSGILNSTEAELDVQWTPDDSLSQGADVRYYEDLSYRLVFEKDSEMAEYSGRCDLYFRDDGQGNWYVFRWVDKRDGSANRTWGWLRGRNMVEF